MRQSAGQCAKARSTRDENKPHLRYLGKSISSTAGMTSIFSSIHRGGPVGARISSWQHRLLDSHTLPRHVQQMNNDNGNPCQQMHTALLLHKQLHWVDGTPQRLRILLANKTTQMLHESINLRRNIQMVQMPTFHIFTNPSTPPEMTYSLSAATHNTGPVWANPLGPKDRIGFGGGLPLPFSWV